MLYTSNFIKDNANKSAIPPSAVIYENWDFDRFWIFFFYREQGGAGIYQRIHKESSNFYIDSSFELFKRFKSVILPVKFNLTLL